MMQRGSIFTESAPDPRSMSLITAAPEAVSQGTSKEAETMRFVLSAEMSPTPMLRHR